jgi:collagen type III alpha
MEEARMTSEGHHAGQPPADATSGGPAEPFGDDGFPPDSENQGRAPASGFPTSYAPPPHATPNGGSPFVVPTVFGQPGSPPPGSPPPSQQPESAGPLPTRHGVPIAQPGQAPPADLADRTTPPPFPPPTAGSARVPGIGESAPLPQRTSGLPQRTPPAGAPPGPPPSAWAPPPANDAFGRPAEPHPYQADESDSGGFTGFAPGSPTRGRAGLEDADQPGSPYDRPATLGSYERPESGSPFGRSTAGSPLDQPRSGFDQPGSSPEQSDGAPLGRPGSLPERPVSGDSGNGRPPGLSAFGDQRVRVPGATLTGLPDAPPPAQGGGLPTRLPNGGQDGSSTALPRRGQSGPADEPVFGATPGSSSQGFPPQTFPAPGYTASASVPSSPGKSPYGDESPSDQPFRRPASDVPADEQQYARPPAGGSVFGRPADDSSYGPAGGESVFGRSAPGESPFGRSAEEPFGRPADEPFGRPAQEPFGRPADEPFGRSADEPFARTGNEAASPFAAPPAGGSPFDGSASPNSWPTAPAHDGSAAGRPDTSPFGGFEPSPGRPDGDGFGGPRANPDAQGTVPGAALFGGFVPRGSAGPRSSDAPSHGADSRDLGTPSSGGPGFGSDRPGSGAPGFGSDRPGSGAPGFGADQSGSGAPDFGSDRPGAPDFGSDRPGAPDFGSDRPGAAGFGSDRPASGAPGFGGGNGPGSSGPGFGGGEDNGFAQRVPGASFAPAGPPPGAEPRNGVVPQPRDPADRPAVGSARAVSASASVPTTSRVAPSDAEEVPPPSAAPQARVYGRPAQPSGDDDAERPEPAETAYPSSGGPPIPPPGRVAGRATASARVAPPGSDPVAPPQSFSELTSDVAGRGQQPGVQPGAPVPPDRYGENTSDISHRGPGTDQPYVPAPALPPMYARPPLENGFPPAPDADQDQNRPRMGGLFPGPATRATVAPPSPDQTSSWPGVETQGPADDTEMARFDQFRPDAEAPPAKPETPHVRMLPVLISVIVGAALLVGLAFGIVWLISRGSDSNAGISVAAGDCVKRSGDEAIKAVCGDAGAFQVVSIADTKEQCADPGQPYVLNPTANGKTQVLCLKPTS